VSILSVFTAAGTMRLLASHITGNEDFGFCSLDSAWNSGRPRDSLASSSRRLWVLPMERQHEISMPGMPPLSDAHPRPCLKKLIFLIHRSSISIIIPLKRRPLIGQITFRSIMNGQNGRGANKGHSASRAGALGVKKRAENLGPSVLHFGRL
jgi:hypothetical protein